MKILNIFINKIFFSLPKLAETLKNVLVSVFKYFKKCNEDEAKEEASETLCYVNSNNVTNKQLLEIILFLTYGM